MSEKILLVDDDVDTLRLVGLMLQRQGYGIVAANSGHQAIVMAQSENPDLILLDIMMPDMDGYEVTRRLRENPSTSAIPIIMFTAKNQMDDRVMGFGVGVDDYLTKPTQPRELFAHIRAVLSRGKKVAAISTLSPSLKDRGFVIGVLAAKGGLGVSTMALNLGICLRLHTEKEVIIAEFRPGEGDMALDLGLSNPIGMKNLLQQSSADLTAAHVNSELVNHEYEVRLLLASYTPNDSRLVSYSDHFEAISRFLAHQSDYIILDLGHSISPITDKVISNCDELIVILEADPHVIMRTQELLGELSERGFGEGRLHSILYNRQRTDLQYPLSQVQQDLHNPVSIVFTAAPELSLHASKNGVPLVILNPDNITSQQFFRLADSITKRVRARE